MNSALGQNVAIAPLLSRPEHEFNAVPGCRTNWPVIVDRIGTNTVSPHADRTVITESVLSDLYVQIGPAFTNWHSTIWANYQRTNAAALDARRLQLVVRRDLILERLNALSNAVDFTALSAPLITSNLVVLRQLEERLGR